MRIDEVIQPEVKKGTKINQWDRTGKFDLRAFIPARGYLNIEAYTKDLERIAYTQFVVDKNVLKADKVFVEPKYRRQGVATAMYDYAESLGNTLAPSDSVMPDGRALWAARGKDINEVITHPGIKTKGASTTNLVNKGQPVPAGQEAKLLGTKVGKLGAYEVYKFDQGNDSAYSIFDPRTRVSQLTVSGHNKAHAFEIFGVYAGPSSPVRASDLYAWLVKNQGLTLLSDKQQSPGGHRVWQDLEQRYGRSINVYAFNMKTNQPINTGADDPESTHGTRGDTAQNVRLVAAPK